MIRVDLPYPHNALWPNGRPHKFEKAREVKKHRRWASNVTMADLAWRAFVPDETVTVHIIVSRKAKGVYPDKDNTVAAAKAYLDGIADRLGINDRVFGTPTVEFLPAITGRFVFEIGGEPR